MSYVRRGVGAYPDDPYFDPNRPSWLPYWIDDSTESALKYNSDSLAGQMGGVVGKAGAAVAGGVADAVAGAADNAIKTSVTGTLVMGALLIGGAFLAFQLVKR